MLDTTLKNNETHNNKLGVIAEDIKELQGEFNITGKSNDGILSVDYNQLMLLGLIEIRKLKKRIEELEKCIC